MEKPDIVVGTPSRVLAHLQQKVSGRLSFTGQISLIAMQLLVLMVDLSFPSPSFL